MEREYIQKKIKSELISTDFKNWNKESIHLLVYVFEFDFLSDLYNLNLLLLKDYIDWCKKNIGCHESIHDDIYQVFELENIYSSINKNILEKRYNINYVFILKRKSISDFDTESFLDIDFLIPVFIPMFIIFVIFVIFIKNIFIKTNYGIMPRRESFIKQIQPSNQNNDNILNIIHMVNDIYKKSVSENLNEPLKDIPLQNFSGIFGQFDNIIKNIFHI